MAMQSTLRAVADPIRREILTMLKGGRMAAGEIAAHFDLRRGGVAASVGAQGGRSGAR